MGIRKRLLLLSLCASAIPYSTPLLAQASPAPAKETGADASADTQGVADIVVTAQFRGQSVQNTPLAITAVTGDTLESRGQTNVQQIGNQIPNVTLKPSTAAWGPSLVASIRGVGQYNFNPALEPGVGVFVDDVYYATLTGSLLDLIDIGRIEVLRGPQGTLTGRNSIGGAIRIISQKPKGDNSGYVEGTGGSRGLLGLRGTVDLGLTDQLALRVSGSVKKQGGYVDRLDYGCVNPDGGLAPTRAAGHCKLGDALGGIGNQAVRGQLSYEPSDRVHLLLSADYAREDHSGPAEVLTYADFDNPVTNPAPGVPIDSRFLCGKYCNYATFHNAAGTDGYAAFESSADPDTHFSGWGLSGTATVDLTDGLKLTSITAYRQYQSSFASDDDLTPGSMSIEAVDLTHRFFSEEARLNGSVGTLEYTIGGYYSDQRTLLKYFFDVRPYLIQYTTDDPIPAQTAAVFGTVIYPVTSRLTFTGGIRYTHERKKYTFYHYRPDGTVDDPTLQGQSSTAKDNVVDYRLSLDYRWSPSLLTYFTASTGFKGGGVNPFPSALVLVQPFKPERLKNYEAGIKADLFDRRLRFNAAVFLDYYSAIQETRLSCPEYGLSFCSLVVNAGNARNKGVELEMNARPIDRLEIDASYSYLDFQFRKMNAATGLSLDFVPPYTPATKWSAGAQYEIDLGALGTLTPRIDAAYQSAIYTNAANAATNRIAPYTVANAHLTWRNDRKDLTVALHVTNLFNKYYFLNSFDLTGTNGVIDSQPASPREFAVTLRKTF